MGVMISNIPKSATNICFSLVEDTECAKHYKINEVNNDLYEKCAAGVLLCKLINMAGKLNLLPYSSESQSANYYDFVIASPFL